VGAATRQVEPNGFLAFMESVSEATKSFERRSSVATVGRAIRAQRDSMVVVRELIHVPALLVAFVP
jgi:hypothetical protein